MLFPGPTNTAIWGRDMPQLQAPEATYATALRLATLPAAGPTGKVFTPMAPYDGGISRGASLSLSAHRH
jgi:hypothetical protein